VLILNHPDLAAPDSLEGQSDEEIYRWKTEYDVATVLKERGHEVRKLHVMDELRPIRELVEEWKPHIVFNLLEEFHGISEFDQHVVAYLELLGVPYTGCNPRGLVLARGKALSKKLVGHHRIRVPGFTVVRRGRRARLPRALAWPVIVKSLTEEASLGISQASVVDREEKLAERVRFIHEKLGTDAIIEEFIEGREFYVGVLGNQRLTVLPVYELNFGKLGDGTSIATERVKHDTKYQDKLGIDCQPARDLPPELERAFVRTTKRIVHILELDGYARVDYRLRGEDEIVFLEANPNPEVAMHEEFASAAEAAGYDYADLLQAIVNLGLRRARRSAR
jgi:D-alanine-D-alanine ligase